MSSAGGWLLTYALHSTVILGGVWLCLRWSRTGCSRFREWLWKAGSVAALVTTSVQVWGGLGLDLLQPDDPIVPTEIEARVLALRGSGRGQPPSPLPGPVEWRGGCVDFQDAPPIVPPDMLIRARERCTGRPYSRRLSTSALFWLLGVAILGIRHAVARRRLGRALAGRGRIGSGLPRRLLDDLEAASGRPRGVRLSASAALTSPVTVGGREIVLPVRALWGLGDRELRAVLAHEFAHVVRRDLAWLAFFRMLERVFFFQPLHRVARRTFEEESELLSDDRAVEWTCDPVGLARALAVVGGWLEDGGRLVPSGSMAAAGGSRLVSRVERVLGPEPPLRTPGVGLRVAALTLMVLPAVAVPRLPLGGGTTVEVHVVRVVEPVAPDQRTRETTTTGPRRLLEARSAPTL